MIRSFVCNMKRPSVKQSIKEQVSSNLADEPSSARSVLPHAKLPEKRANSSHIYTVNENPFETVNL